jgi:hypothetical protein
MIGFALILDFSVYLLGVYHFTQVSCLFLGDQTTNTVMRVLATNDQAPISFLGQMTK